MIEHVRPGEPVRAKKFNEIIDSVNAAAATGTRLEGIKFSAGPGINASGNAISANAPRAKRPVLSGILDGDADFPFAVSMASAGEGKVSVVVASGMWYGNGEHVMNGVPNFDAFSVPESSIEFAPQKPFAAVVLYAFAEFGVIKEDPAIYLVETDSRDEIFEKLREYAYSTAVVVGVWKVAEGDVSEDPGQILKSNHRYVNPNGLYSGFFGWAVCDGAKNTFRVNDGLALVRPHRLAYGQNIGDVLKIAKDESSTTISVSVPVKTSTLKTQYPEEEIEFLKKIVVSAGSSTVDANVDVPLYKVSSTKKTAALGTFSVESSAKKIVTKVALSKATTTIYAKPDGVETYYPGILTIGTDADVSSEIVSLPSVTTSTSTISYVEDVSASPDGKTTVSIEIPVGQKISEETGKIKPLLGASIETSESTEDVSAEVPLVGFTAEKADESTLATVSSEIFAEEQEDCPELSPKIFPIPGMTITISDSDLASGAVIWLQLAFKDGALNSKWLVGNVLNPPESIGEVPQKLSISVEAKTVEVSDDEKTSIAFAVKSSAKAPGAGTFSTCVPMAVVTKTPVGVALQRVHEGVVEVTPSLEIVFNKEASEEEQEKNSLSEALGAGSSQRLPGTRMTKPGTTNAEAALAHALSGEQEIFPIEAEDFDQAEGFKVCE